MQITDFPKIERYMYEKYALRMNYRKFLKMVAECCESSFVVGIIPRKIPVSVNQLEIIQLENGAGVALNYDLFDKHDQHLLRSVGIVLQCSEEEQKKILSQPRVDILMLLSVLENGIASSKRCAEEAVAVLEKNLIPVSEDYFPSLRKVSA